LACPTETLPQQLAPVLVGRSLLAVYRLSARLRGFRHSDLTCLRSVNMSYLSELQPSFRVRPVTERPRSRREPLRTLVLDHDFLPGGSSPLQRFPHMRQRLFWPGLPRPTTSVFRFSQPLDALPPHACRPYFMPDPLMGFPLQSFIPLKQPFAVSSVDALLVLDNPFMLSSPSGLYSTRESATDNQRFRLGTSA
jgi:hypothetical protein